MALFGKKAEGEKQRDIEQIAQSAFKDVVREVSGAGNNLHRKIPDNIIAFVGGAGGTGTSTVLANVAKQLSADNRSVLLIDLNILFPVQHTYFNCKVEEMNHDLLDFLSGKVKMNKAIVSIGDLALLFALERNVMDYVSVDQQSTADFWEETLDRLRDLFDVILIDVPYSQLNSSIVNMTLYKADRVYVVWDENVACIGNTENMQNSLAVTGIDLFFKIRLIFNKKTSVKYDTFPIKELRLKLVTTLPFEVDIITSGLQGEIFVSAGQSGTRNAGIFTKGIAQIAQHIVYDSGYRGDIKTIAEKQKEPEVQYDESEYEE